MPTLTINGRSVEVPTGATVLDALCMLGIHVPTLCHRDGFPPSTSCMVCVVEDRNTGRMIPSCTARVADTMVIETDNANVRDARRVALELLLSDHVGDCEAPCRRVCTAHMDVPLMLRQIAGRQFHDALATVKASIPFPATLGRICPAPCEKACRRAQHDDAVSICLLKRFVGDIDLAAPSRYVPPCAASTGKRISIVGAGPAGLTAAYFLLQHGHACTVLDANSDAGGALRHAIGADRLPRNVLDAEIDVLRAMGATFRMRTRLGRDVQLADLRAQFNAIVLTPGKFDAATAAALSVAQKDGGIAINAHTGETDLPGVFAGGDAVREHKMAIRAVGAGRSIAAAVDQFLTGASVTGLHHRFDSMIGKLSGDETRQLVEAAATIRGIHTPSDVPTGLSEADAVRQAARCLHCDCVARDQCALRTYADDYDARQRRYTGDERQPFEHIRQHPRVVYEPGKCIKCSLCVQITRRAGERLGLTFIGRGFDLQVGVPLDGSMADALTNTVDECVAACPTGALVFKPGLDATTHGSPR